MRFLQIHLKAHGHFTDCRVDLPMPRSHDFHIVVGPNEAGKSTMRRALCDLLFGFRPNTPDDFLHEGRMLRVGAVIQCDQQPDLHVYRRKGRVGTLVGPDDKPLNDDVLATLCGSVDREYFERLFALDHERLRRGAADLLASGGDAGFSLFEAGAGVAGVKAVLQELESRADDLYKSRGRNQKIPALKKALTDNATALAQAAISGADWERGVRTLGEVEKEIASVRGHLDEISLRRKHIQRIKINVRAVADYRAGIRAVEELHAVPRLLPDATVRRLDAEHRQVTALAACERISAGLDSLRGQRAGISLHPEIIASADAIRSLADRRGSVTQALEHIPRRETEAELAHAEIASLIREAGLEAGVETVAGILPTAPVSAELQEMIQARASLDTSLSVLEGDVRSLEGDIARHQDEIERICEPADTGDIADLAEIVSGLGPIESVQADDRVQIGHLDAEISQKLGALAFWKGDLESFVKLRVPPRELVERYNGLISQAEDRLVQMKALGKEASQVLTQAENRLLDVENGGTVFTVEKLEAARARREEGWRLIRDTVIVPQTDAARISSRERLRSAVDGYTGGDDPLAQAYERAVRDADDVSDGLRENATRTANYVAALADLRRQQARLNDLRADYGEARDARDSLDREWRGHWPAGIAVSAPADMAGWLRERDAILKLSAQSEQLRQRAADRATQIEDLSLRLSGALAAAGAPPQQAAESLASLLARARRLVREAEEGRAARRSAFEAVSHARRQLSDKMQKLTEARKSLMAWRGRWAAATRDLVGDRAASPGEISAMLRLLGDIKERIAARQTALHRVEAMAADVAGFNETCAGLAAALLPDFQSAEPVALSRALQAALEQAEAVAVEARRLDGEIRARENELAEETTNLARARDDLTSLCRQAGCACPAELPDAEDLARRRDTAEHDLEEARKALLAQSEGLDLEQIVAQVCEADLDALDREVADLDRRSADLNEQATELGARRAEARRAIREMEAAAGAGPIAEEYQSAKAKYIDAVHEYVRLTAAAQVLRGAIEQYREANQAPVLARANELFVRLSENSFTRLSLDPEQGVIYGERDGRSVPVEGMSDGARDQLFLSLRLAAIDRVMSGRQSLPFIADDILINCDDSRSAAALRVLADLGTRTQVVYFTHHHRIGDIATDVLGDRVLVHELPMRGPAGRAQIAAE